MDPRLQMTPGSANPLPSPQSGSGPALSPPGAAALSHLPDCKTREKQGAVCPALTQVCRDGYGEDEGVLVQPLPALRLRFTLEKINLLIVFKV